MDHTVSEHTNNSLRTSGTLAPAINMSMLQAIGHSRFRIPFSITLRWTICLWTTLNHGKPVSRELPYIDG